MIPMDAPKRSHSLVNNKKHHQSKTAISQQELLKQQPCASLSTTPQRTASVGYQQPRLTRSSSLSQHSKNKPPSRSKSFTQKPITHVLTTSPPPIPSSPSFLFLQHEPPSQLQSQLIKLPKRSSSLKGRTSKKNSTLQGANDEVTKALLEWKDKSTFKVDWANMFSPTVQLWKMNENIFGSVEDLLNYKGKNGNEEVEIAANALWLEDENFVLKKDVASYLGKLDPFSHRVLRQYMDNFDFIGMKVDEAFRKLCSKLYFKAEAQEIDRILEVFSHKYWNDNKNKLKVFKAADVVYTITYSIMLLNTDLHLVQISSHAKMSCALFCENTMSTILEQSITLDNTDKHLWINQLEDILKDVYTSVKSNGILQPILEEEPKSFLKRMGSLTQRKKRSASLSSAQSQ